MEPRPPASMGKPDGEEEARPLPSCGAAWELRQLESSQASMGRDTVVVSRRRSPCPTKSRGNEQAGRLGGGLLGCVRRHAVRLLGARALMSG